MSPADTEANPGSASWKQQGAEELLDDSKQGPPRAWVLIADWFNVIAGVVLMCAFGLGALINSVKMESLLVPTIGIPTEKTLDWLQFFFCAEGFLYAVAEFFMVAIMAQTPVQFGGGSRGCMQFAILMAGGIFFGFSGLVYPGCVTNLTYVLRKTACTSPAATGPYAWNAVAHFGITCFMVGTTIGFTGVLKAPRKPFIGPFWGCFFYFAGAWTIGIFKFWGPVILGGFDSTLNDGATAWLPGGDAIGAPTNAYTWNWWFGLLGAGFLTLGAGIFLVMNGSYRCK